MVADRCEVNVKIAQLVPFLASAFPLAAPAGPYGPFDADETYIVTLNPCETSEDVQQVHPPLGSVDFRRATDEATLHLTMTGTTHYEAQVFSNGVARSQSVNVKVQATVPTDVGGGDAVCDDLNGDGATDFVVALWGHGNGLGASFYDRLIALSGGENYRFWVIPTTDPTHEDFVRFSAAQPIVMVTRQFVQKNDVNSERASYFVFDLWSFSGGEVAKANSLDRRFPKWVRYTAQPNSRPAPLSDADKRQLRPDPQPIEALP